MPNGVKFSNNGWCSSFVKCMLDRSGIDGISGKLRSDSSRLVDTDDGCKNLMFCSRTIGN